MNGSQINLTLLVVLILAAIVVFAAQRIAPNSRLGSTPVALPIVLALCAVATLIARFIVYGG